MTEAERNSFFAHSTQRAPGKRQIKPTAAMEHMVLPADEDEDDEDFKAELSGSGSDESSSDSNSESSEGEDEEKGEGEDDEDIDYLKSLKNRGDNEDEEEVPLCSLCLNLRPSCVKEEVIQCDKCGVAVHESCYGIDVEVSGDDDSTESASVTEPWFCEPCVYGEKEPPHCELCPGRYGALKRSDIGGRWVHLICALHTPGITFGDADRLMAISWQEIDYKIFGKRACAGCTDRLESRTGIAIGCDAALCKNYYHATCAQKLGLLIDRSDEMNGMAEEEFHDERFIHCKKHSHEEEVRKKREAYQQFIRQEEKRFATMLKRKRLNEREEEKRAKMEEKSNGRWKKMEGVTVSVPDASWDRSDKKNRRARHLHTSARYLEAFFNKAESVGVSRDSFEKAFIRVDGRTLSFLPPAFSNEFIAYFNHREKHVMAAERGRLERVEKEKERLREEQEKREEKMKELDKDHRSAAASVAAASERLTRLHGILSRLGAKKLPKMGEVVRKESGVVRPRLLSRSSICSDSPSTSVRHPPAREIMKKCATCTQIKDQHLLVECDACHKHYHLHCLNPPLEKMPKKRNFHWHCSDCAPSSSDEDGGKGDVKMECEDEDSNGARKLRHRSDSVKQRKKEEKEAELRDYRSAIGRGCGQKRVVKKNKRYSTATPPPPPPPPPSTLTPRVNSTASTTLSTPSRQTPVLPPSSTGSISSPIDGEEPPTKRGRGRPRKTPQGSPEKNGRLSVETTASRKSHPPLSPQPVIGGGKKANGKVPHESVENEDDEDAAMEQIVILKE